jgi:hypothetical protein
MMEFASFSFGLLMAMSVYYASAYSDENDKA